VLREAMAKKRVAARSCVVLYQRGREVVIQPFGKGMLLTELRNHDEMISEKTVFDDLKSPRYDQDLLEIAGLLIDKTKFDPSKFEVLRGCPRCNDRRKAQRQEAAETGTKT